MPAFDVAIVGAGVIGSAIAWELTEHGQRVLLLDSPRGRNSASWAAAGMLPPMGSDARDPLDRLQGFSHEVYPTWLARLQQMSDVDVHYWPCGSLHVATAVGESAALVASATRWEEDGVRFERVDPADLPAREPALAAAAGSVQVAYFLPDQRQLSPRLLLTSLHTALARRPAAIVRIPEDKPLEIDDERDGWRIQSGNDQFSADVVCLAAGAYTCDILRPWDLLLDLEPRRGQMIQLPPSSVRPAQIIEQGPRYLVPRRDGRILVGSTVEDVGFNDATQQDDLVRLHEFAAGLIPSLSKVAIESAWAGLRPWVGNGYPILCDVPSRPHAWLATGHFRYGIQLAPATAIVMRQLILHQATSVDTHAFRL